MGKSLAVRIISILFGVIFGLSVLLGVVFFIKENEDLLLVWTYALTVIAIGITALFGLANMFKTKKTLISSLLVIVGFLILGGISYSLSSDYVPLDAAGKPLMGITEIGSKWSGTILYLLYILLGLSFVSLVYTEIRAIFK